MKILFVCTANIVRSFMAERILRGMLDRMEKENITVSSAGIIDMDGAPADFMAVDLLHEHGFDGIAHHSKPLTDEMISEADMIVVMEDIQRKIIIREHPESEGRIFLLKSFSKDFTEDDSAIKDPYKLSPYHYRLCFSEIYSSIDGLVKRTFTTDIPSKPRAS